MCPDQCPSVLRCVCLQDGYAKFTPHYMMRKCSYEADTHECTNNCIHGGRYCAVDSIDDEFSGKFKGWQVFALAASVSPDCVKTPRGFPH